jgi:hypothetical protein
MCAFLLPRTVATTRHTWRDGQEGLFLRTQQWLGLMEPQSIERYDASMMAPMANLVVKEK